LTRDLDVYVGVLLIQSRRAIIRTLRLELIGNETSRSACTSCYYLSKCDRDKYSDKEV